MKDFDINKMKNSFYTSLVLLFIVNSLFRTNYSTPITLDFGGYDSHSDTALIIEPDNNSQITPPFNFKIEYNLANNYTSYFYDTNDRHLLNLKLNKYLFPQNISVKYQYPIFIKSQLKNKVIINLQIYQNDPPPLIS